MTKVLSGYAENRIKLLRGILPLLVAILFLSIVLYHTHGKIVVGGDFVGYYDFAQPFTRFNIQDWLYGLALLLSGNDIYTGYYLYLFIGIVINLYAIRMLFNELINRSGFMLSNTRLLLAELVLYLMFIFSLSSFIAVRLSVYTPSLIQYAALAIVVTHILRAIDNCSISLTNWKDVTLLVLSSAIIATTPFPNNLRLYALVLSLWFIVCCLVLITRRDPVFVVYTLRYIILFSLLFVVFITPLLISLNKFVEIARYAAYAHHYTELREAPYAIPVNTLRLLGSWAFPTRYAPYHDMYMGSNPIVTIASFIAPLSLGILILLTSDKPKMLKLKVLTLLVVTVICLSWDLADNTIIGYLNRFVAELIPYSRAIFPTHFLSATVLRILYAVFLSYVALNLLERLNRIHRLRLKRVVKLLVLLLIYTIIVFSIMLSALPMLSGVAIAEYWNQSIKGINIPKEYFTIKYTILRSCPNGTVLLYPATRTYVGLIWGFQGAVSFYNRLFYPLKILTLASFGGYAEYTPLFKNYLRVSIPQLIPTNITSTNNILRYATFVKGYGLEVNITKSYIRIMLPKKLIESRVFYDIVLKFTKPFDLSQYKYIILTIHTINGAQTNLMQKLVSHGILWIGISSPRKVGWYIISLYPSINKYVNVSNNKIIIALRIGNPDKPWPASSYDPHKITGVVIRFKLEKSEDPLIKSILNKSLLLQINMSLGRDYTVSPDYISLIRALKVHYIVYDESIKDGIIVNRAIYHEALNLMLKSGLIKTIYKGKYLELYKVINTGQ